MQVGEWFEAGRDGGGEPSEKCSHLNQADDHMGRDRGHSWGQSGHDRDRWEPGRGGPVEQPCVGPCGMRGPCFASPSFTNGHLSPACHVCHDPDESSSLVCSCPLCGWATVAYPFTCSGTFGAFLGSAFSNANRCHLVVSSKTWESASGMGWLYFI